MKLSEGKIRLLQHKNYLDTGLGLTHYAQYLLIFFGWATSDVKATFWIAVGYAVFCYVLGWCFYRFGWMHAQNEVNNRFNPFVEEVRKDLNNSVTTINHG